MNRKKTLDLNAPVFTTAQVARICGVSSQVVAKWMKRGMLKGRRLPGSSHRRFDRVDVVEFLKVHGLPTRGMDLQ